jgi:hypothetical protein
MPATVEITLAFAGVVTSKRMSNPRIVRLSAVVTPETARERMMRPSRDTARSW